MSTSQTNSDSVLHFRYRSCGHTCSALGLAVVMLFSGASGADEIVPSFEDPVLFPTHILPWGLGVGDITGDGYPEIVITHCVGKIMIYRNVYEHEPEVGLRPLQTLEVREGGVCLGEVEFADMNGDEFVDLVVAAKWEPYFWVFMADEYGHFPDPEEYDEHYVQNSVVGLVVRDLDNDGWNDVALAATWEQFGPLNWDRVITMWNTADWTGWLNDRREVDLNLPWASFPHDLVAGHFEKRPGFLDLVTANPQDDTICLLVNHGNRVFTVETTSMPAECPPGAWKFDYLTSGHFKTGNVTPEVAGSAPSDLHAAVIHCNTWGEFSHDCTDDRYKLLPTGGESNRVDMESPSSHSGLLNGAGKPDLAFAMYDTDQVAVLLGKGDGTFQAPSPDSAYLYSVDNDPNVDRDPRDVRIVDLDQDGFGDLVTCNRGIVNNSGTISVLINRLTVTAP